MGKVFVAIAGGAIGDVFGAKAGRERYDQIRGQASRIWHDPRVQQKAAQAGDAVEGRASQATDTVKDRFVRAKDKIAESDEIPGISHRSGLTSARHDSR